MIIQHNIMALNAHRQLGGNNSLVSKNLEKLSSGYKINRAGDDAAGLAISEKMRSQIKGLDRAKLNAQDGISLVQTAEGALTETHSMLNRLVELGTEAANGTIQASDRQKIQDEVDALTDEINRISQATNFNGINLLDGSLEGGAVNATDGAAAIGGTKAVTTIDMTTIIGGAADPSGLAANDTLTLGGFTHTFTGASIAVGATAQTAMEAFVAAANADTTFSASYSASYDAANGSLILTAKSVGVTTAPTVGATTVGGIDSAAAVTAELTTVAGTPPTTAATAGQTTIDIKDNPKGGTIMNVGNVKFEFVKEAGTAAAGNTEVVIGETLADTMATLQTELQGATVAGADMANATVGADGKIVINAVAGTAAAPVVTFEGGGLVMQVGDTAADFNKVAVAVGNMSSKGLGLDGLKMLDLTKAADSIDKVNKAVEIVSTARGKLGALQNRLEHTINNLGVTSENMVAAESRIRDVDMAKEMMDFTKNNVLTQAAQAMLAQANQQPQQVLQLLR